MFFFFTAYDRFGIGAATFVDSITEITQQIPTIIKIYKNGGRLRPIKY